MVSMRGKLGWRVGGTVLAVGLAAAGCETQESAQRDPGAAAGPEGAQQPLVPVQNTLAYDAAGLARQMRTLDALRARGDTNARDSFVSLNTVNPDLPVSRFINAYARDDRRAAWRDLDGIRKSYPGSALGYVGMLSVYVEWKLLQEAEDMHARALKLDGKLAVAHARLGNLHAQKGNTDKARGLYEQALAADPEDGDALLGLARLAAAAGDKERALDLYTRGGRAWPENAALVREHAGLLEELGRRKDAARVYLLAANLERRPYEQLMKAAVMLAQEGDRRGAEQVYEQALAHNPSDGDLLVTLSQLAAERGDADAQVRYQSRAVEQRPDDVELHRALAAHFVARGETAGADRHLREVVRLAPQDQLAHLQLAQMAHAQGREREMLEHYLDAAAVGPLPDVDAARRDALERSLMLPPAPATGATVQKVFDAALKSIIAAYEARLKEKPDLAGAVTAEVEVGADGKVISLKLKEDTLADERLSTTIYFTLKQAVFPEGKRSKFNYPLTFAPPRKKGKK